jgi:hypothetical protein
VGGSISASRIGELLPLLQKAINERDVNQFMAIESVVRAVIEHAFASSDAPSWEALLAHPGFAQICNLVMPEILVGSSDNPVKERLLNIFLTPDDYDGGRKRIWFFQHLLANPDASVETKRWVLQQMQFVDLVSAYVVSRHDTHAKGNSAREASFFNQVQTLMRIGKGKLPNNTLMAYLYAHPDQEERFIQTFEDIQTKELMSIKTDRHGSGPLTNKLDQRSYFTRPDQYQRDFLSAAQQHQGWVPDVRSEMDILFTYFEAGGATIANYDTFSDSIEGLRNNYVLGVNPLGSYENYPEHTITTLQGKLAQLLPSRPLTETEVDYLTDWLARKNGRVEVGGLIQYLSLTLSSDQHLELHRFAGEGG